YQPGRRSEEWLKVKHVRSADFIIGGYTAGNGARRDQFGALMLGVWSDGALQPVGNVGSGFDDKALASISRLIHPRTIPKMPFASKPEADGNAVWVKPELVAEVKFAGWTDSTHLRAPVFIRMRDDIDPKAVTLDRAKERSVGPEGANSDANGGANTSSS